MSKAIIYTKQLPYKDVVNLKNDGSLELRIDSYSTLSVLIQGRSNLGGKGWHWFMLIFDSLLTALTLGFTIYSSVTGNWWWFLIGLLIVPIFWQNTSTTAQEIVEKALKDEAFYNRIAHIQGWFYVIEEETLNSIKVTESPDSNSKSEALAPACRSVLRNALNYAYSPSVGPESKTYAIICLWARILAIGYSIYTGLTLNSWYTALGLLIILVFGVVPVLALLLEHYLRALTRTYIGGIQLASKIYSKPRR